MFVTDFAELVQPRFVVVYLFAHAAEVGREDQVRRRRCIRVEALQRIDQYRSDLACPSLYRGDGTLRNVLETEYLLTASEVSRMHQQ